MMGIWERLAIDLNKLENLNLEVKQMVGMASMVKGN